MKCVCGYEYREGYIPEINKDGDSKRWGIVMGNEDFLFLSYVQPVCGEHGGETYKVWACPKCGTIKIEV
jgi:hypothetical protein